MASSSWFPTRVLNDNAMVADITAHPNAITDHVTADAANAQEVRTRQSTFVPFEFVKYLYLIFTTGVFINVIYRLHWAYVSLSVPKKD